MVSQDNPRSVATLESFRTYCCEYGETVTVGRGEHGFLRLAELVSEGASAADGAAILRFSDRGVGMVLMNGDHRYWTWDKLLHE